QHGRQFAAWLGRGPRPPATGGKARWWDISNRGAVYRRQLLVQRARATLRWGGLQADRRRQWLRGLLARRGKRKTAGGPRQEKRADGLGAPHDRASVQAEQQRPKRI